MITRHNLLFGAAVALALGGFSACDKDNDDTANPQTSNNYVDPVGEVAIGAVLVTARANVANPVTVPGLPNIDLTIDVPVAILYKDSQKKVVGGVAIDDQALTEAGQVYSLGQNLVSSTGEFFAYTNRAWSVQAGGDVEAFTFTPTRAMPSVGELTAPENVVKGMPYTLSVSRVTGADSILFNIGGVTRTVAPRTLSVTFTGEETNRVLGGSNTVAQVAGYNVERRDIASYPVYHVSQEVKTKYVTSN